MHNSNSLHDDYVNAEASCSFVQTVAVDFDFDFDFAKTVSNFFQLENDDDDGHSHSLPENKARWLRIVSHA